MRRPYQIASREGSAALRQFLAKEGAVLLPMVELIEQGQLAVEALVGQLGQATLEAVLAMSADQVAGPPHPGRPGGAIRRHGAQGGVVALGGQRVRVSKPRLRRKGSGEVAVPAYAVMRNDRGLRERLFVIDGGKALRAAIDAVYGTDNPVQRCRTHKLRNVLGYLPKEIQAQVAAALRAAWKLDPKEGMARLRTQIEWLELSYPEGGGESAGGIGVLLRRIHHQSPGAVADAAHVPGDHQHHRKLALGGGRSHRAGDSLALGRDGPAVGGGGGAGDGEELPQDHGAQGPLDAESGAGRGSIAQRRVGDSG